MKKIGILIASFHALLLFAIGLLLNGCEMYGDESDPDSKVWIPDDEFLERLIDAGFDTNEDGKISYAEAAEVTSLNVTGPGPWEEDKERIHRLVGIEAFVNLKSLDCSGNIYIKYLDLSNNTSLDYLDCEINQIKSLDLSNNTALTYLNCYSNNLESLDLESNTEQGFLDCSMNYDLSYMEYQVVHVSGNYRLKI